MNVPAYNPWLNRLAVLTACVALLPIAVGALVTTMNWGMAFLDWPASDGHNMFLYPWLQAAADKFAEHGHRLAGALIGVVSAVTMVVVWMKERRAWVRWLATLIPFLVLGQGVLGGMRVLADDSRMAMFHGSFAAVVFTLMAALALFTGREWIESPGRRPDAQVDWLKPLALAAPAVLVVQYLLGGALRHLGMSLHEHIAVAVLSFAVVTAAAVAGFLSGDGWLRRFAWKFQLLLVVQLLLGLGAFVTKYGFAPAGYVAVERSLPQVVLRTSHTVVGMLLLMTSVLFALLVYRLSATACGVQPAMPQTAGLDRALGAEGGPQ